MRAKTLLAGIGPTRAQNGRERAPQDSVPVSQRVDENPAPSRLPLPGDRFNLKETLMQAATPYQEQPHSLLKPPESRDAAWVANVAILWENRRFLVGVVAAAFVLSAAVSLLLPKQYESSTRIMPPEQTTGSAAMLAALTGRASASSGLAGLASGLLGARGNGALFIDLLRSGTISGHLIDRFHLQHVYRKRYVEDTAKKLARKTSISEDSKSGVITIVVEDTDRGRARDLAQAYIDELNTLVARVNTSSARREREFIEQRLQTVGQELQQAQVEMSNFSTKNAAIDIKEQTRAMVDAGARLQGQLVASESELDSLRQIYGSENVRVRAAEARVSTLRRELGRESNGSDAQASEETGEDGLPYPGLRQLPALAVPWANFYRRVRIQETVYEMLSAQYETARIEEAKSIPTVSVIDFPSWPEKKSSPHRLIIILMSTLFAFVAASLFLLAQRSWRAMQPTDARKILAREIATTLQSYRAQYGGGGR
jgi:capsule polysaccharide export protein KpsE/RkpR